MNVTRARALRRVAGLGGLVWVCFLSAAAGAFASAAFTPVSGSPFQTGGLAPVSVAFSPSGALLATANNSDSTVSVFSVSSAGALTPVPGSPFATGPGPVSVAFSPSGGLLATANVFDSAVSVFSVGSAGALTPVSGSPFATGSAAFSVAFSPSGGLFATANEADSTVSVLSVGRPSAVIGSPNGGATYKIGQAVPTSFSCTDAPAAPGVASCVDSNGSSPGSGQLSTQTLGSHTYTVTAKSKDGQTGTASISYKVAGAPVVSISSPASGAIYTRGQPIDAAYDCREGAFGPGLASCAGPVAAGMPVDTSTAGVHRFTVSAVSNDGQRANTTVTYTVAAPAVVRPDNRFAITGLHTRPDGTVSFRVAFPGPGTADVMESAWRDNFARAAILLGPAPRRFVFARKHLQVSGAGTVSVTVTPNKRGRRLIHHHRYAVVIRLWVSYIPTNGTQRNIGLHGLHLTHAKHHHHHN